MLNKKCEEPKVRLSKMREQSQELRNDALRENESVSSAVKCKPATGSSRKSVTEHNSCIQLHEIADNMQSHLFACQVHPSTAHLVLRNGSNCAQATESTSLSRLQNWLRPPLQAGSARWWLAGIYCMYNVSLTWPVWALLRIVCPSKSHE